MGAGILEHSRANAKLKEGLQKLGVHYGEIPRNTGTGHACGHCSFGCAHGEKQDGTATFLADAVQLGAKIITGKGTMSPCDPQALPLQLKVRQMSQA